MKKTYIVVASSIMLLFCLAYQGAYAYFTTSSVTEGNFNTDISSGTISDLIISDGNHVTSNNLIPGDSITNTFTVQNPNNLKVCFNLLWSDVVNEFINKADLVITLTDQSGRVLVSNKSFPSANDEILAENLSINGNTTNTYTLTITYKNTDQNQIADMGKTFSGTITGIPVTCQPTIAEQIIATVDTTGACPVVNDDGTVQVTAAESTNSYLCSAPDDYGTSYYYRGNVQNNWVKFAGYYWRIIRINGDGSIRIIYDGTSAHANGESNTDRQIGRSAYNSSRNDNAYVGYMYGTVGSDSYEGTHANTNDSTIKTYLDSWYKTNIEDKGLSSYVSDTLFCNDRTFNSSNSGTGTGTSVTYYRWYYGPWSSTGRQYPRLTCTEQNDRFTVDNEVIGNGDLTYPIGLVTTDEVVLAGGYNTTNSEYYLYSGNTYWTMSPSSFLGSYAYVRVVDSDGNVNGNGHVDYSYGVRPTLNLLPDSLKVGSGTADDPYRMTE